MRTTTSKSADNRSHARPSRRQAQFAFSILLIINILNYADRYVLPAVLPKVQKEFGLTTFQLGLLGSSFLIVYALAALPLGVWADRSVRKNIVTICVAVWSLATLLVGSTRNFAQLFSLRAILGIGEAGYSPATQSLIGDYFSRDRRARVLSYWSSGNLIGAAVGLMVGGIVADAFGWRWAFYGVGIPGLIVAFLAWRLVEPKRGITERSFDDAVDFSLAKEGEITLDTTAHNFWVTAKGFFRIPTYWAVLFALAFSFFTIGGTSFWLPSYLVNTFNLTLSKAGILSGVALVSSGLIGTVAGGWLADHMQRRRPEGRLLVSACGFIIGAPLVFLGLSIHNLSVFMFVFMIAGTFLSFCTGPLIAVIQDIIVPHARATAIGLTGLVAHLLGDASAPSAIGSIANNHTLGFALIITAPAGLFLAGLVCLFGMRTVAQDMTSMRKHL